MDENILIEKLGYNKTIKKSIKSMIFELFDDVNTINSSHYTKSPILTQIFKFFYFSCLLIYNIQILGIFAEKSSFVLNEGSKGDLYFYNFLISVKFNEVMKSSTSNALIYFVTLLTLGIFLLSILKYFGLKFASSSFFSYMIYYGLKIFDSILLIPLIDGAIKILFCSENTYFNINNLCQFTVYDYKYRAAIILMSFALALAMILKGIHFFFLSNGFLFDSNYDYKLINNGEFKSFMVLIVYFLITDSSIFSSQSAIHILMVISFIDCLYCFKNISYLKIKLIYFYSKIIIFYFAFTNVIAYHFQVEYVCIYFITGSIIILFVNYNLFNSKTSNLSLNQSFSNVTSVNDILLIIDYLHFNITNISSNQAKANIQSFITMMKRDVLEARDFSKQTLHLPFTCEWSKLEKIEIHDRVLLSNLIPFVMGYYIEKNQINDFNLLINLSYYYLEYLDHIYKSLHYLLMCKEEAKSISEYFIVYRMEKLLGNRINKLVVRDLTVKYELTKIDTSNFFIYEDKRKEFIKKFKFYLTSHYSFWCLAKGNKSNTLINYNTEDEIGSFNSIIATIIKKDKELALFNITKELVFNHKELINIYISMTKINDSWIELWTIYENFLNSIEYDLEFLNILSNHLIEIEQRNKREIGKIPFSSLFSSKDTTPVVMSGEKKTSGRIEYISKNCKKIFGYSQSELLYSPVELLMPELIAVRHEAYMHLYFTTGEKTSINKTVNSFGLTKDRQIIEIYSSIKWLPYFDKLNFISLIQKKFGNNNNIILFDYQFNIRNISSSLKKIWDIDDDILRTEQIPVYFLSKNLLKMILQQYIKMSKQNFPDLAYFERFIVEKNDQDNVDKNLTNSTINKNKFNKNNFSKSNIGGNGSFKDLVGKRLKYQELNRETFMEAVIKVFSSGPVAIQFHVHSEIRADSILRYNKSKNNNTTNIQTGYVQFSEDNNIIYNDIKSVSLGNNIKSEIVGLKEALYSGQFDLLMEKMNHLFDVKEEMKLAKLSNQFKRRKGQTLYFKQDCKLMCKIPIDKIPYFSISFIDEVDNELLQGDKSNSIFEEQQQKLKIEKPFGYEQSIIQTETDFKFSKFKKTKQFKEEILNLESVSNIFKATFDLDFLKQSQDSHSSSCQVMNKQVKYNRISSKLENLQLNFAKSKRMIIIIIFLNFGLFLGIFSMIFSQYYNIFNIMTSCTLHYSKEIDLYNNFLITHFSFALLKLAWDSEIKFVNRNNLTPDSQFHHALNIEQFPLFTAFDFETNEDFMNFFKKVTLYQITKTTTLIEENLNLSQTDNSCFDKTYFFSTYSVVHSNPFHEQIIKLKLQNFKDTYKEEAHSEENEEAFVGDFKENPYLLMESLYNQLIDIKMIVLDANFSSYAKDNIAINYINWSSEIIFTSLNKSFYSLFDDKIFENNLISASNVSGTDLLIQYAAISLGTIIFLNIIIYLLLLRYLSKNTRIRLNVVGKIDNATVNENKQFIHKSMVSLDIMEEQEESSNDFDKDVNKMMKKSSNNTLISKKGSSIKKIASTRGLIKEGSLLINKPNLNDITNELENNMIDNLVKLRSNLYNSYFGFIPLQTLLSFAIKIAILAFFCVNLNTFNEREDLVDGFIKNIQTFQVYVSKGALTLLDNYNLYNKIKNQRNNITFFFDLESVELQMREFVPVSLKVFNTTTELYDIFYEKKICQIMSGGGETQLINGVEECLNSQDEFYLLEYYEKVREKLVFLNNFGIENYSREINYLFNHLTNEFKRVNEYIYHDIVSTGYFENFLLGIKNIDIFYIVVALFFICFGVFMYYQVYDKYNTIINNIGSIFFIIPFRNTNDLEMIDRFLTQSEIS